MSKNWEAIFSEVEKPKTSLTDANEFRRTMGLDPVVQATLTVTVVVENLPAGDDEIVFENAERVVRNLLDAGNVWINELSWDDVLDENEYEEEAK